MRFFATYTENIRIVYRSPNWSRACFFNFIIFCLVIICPYLIAYRTQGFWTKLNNVREQPIVQFKHQVLLTMEVDKENNREKMVWSTFKSLNEMLGTKVTPFITSREGDHNMDGIFEYLDLQLIIPLERNVRIQGFHIFLLFDYKLMKHASVQMESLAYTNYYVGGGNKNRFNLYADMGLAYKAPLWSRIRDNKYNKSVIPRKSTSVRDYDIRKILMEYSGRNITTVLQNKYEFTEEDANILANEFLFSIRINYAEAVYECWAGLWNTIKWAWIQYLAIYIVVFKLLKKFQQMVYKAKMFETLIHVPWEKRTASKSIISHQHH